MGGPYFCYVIVKLYLVLFGTVEIIKKTTQNTIAIKVKSICKYIIANKSFSSRYLVHNTVNTPSGVLRLSWQRGANRNNCVFKRETIFSLFFSINIITIKTIKVNILTK